MFIYIYINLFLSFICSKEIFAPNYLNKILSLILCIILVIFVGLRYRVGGDWVTYEAIYFNTRFLNFFDIFKLQDSLFYILNYFISKNGFENGFILVNLIISIFIFFSFYKFINFNKLSLLSFIIFYPFIIIVLMGFLRQSVCLGFLFLILSNDIKKNIRKNIIYSILAGLFHNSGFVFLLIPFLYFFSTTFYKNKISYLLLFLATIILSIYLYPKFMYKFYIFNEYVKFTLGGLYKSLPIFLSSLIFILFNKNFKDKIINFRFYLTLSIITIFSYFCIFILGSVIDRMLIFSIPLMILSLSKLYEIINLKIYKISYFFCIITFFLFFIIYWLNYSNNSASWVPYNIYIPGCCKKPYDFVY